MKALKLSTLLLTLIITFVFPDTSLAQKRSGKRAPATSGRQSSGEQEAARFWSNYIASCGGSHYGRKAQSIFVELRGFHVQMKYDPITEAARLNGIEAKGQSWFEASAYRIYSNSRWGAWGNGIPQDMQLTNSIRFQKARGRWNFYGVGYFNDYAKTVTCSDIPGFRSAKMNEVPTNSVQISDYHNFPIRSFIFWDAKTSAVGDKFPQSTTTFVNWKITYSGTAFSYSLPPVESHWYKDGAEWSYAGSANFDNVGEGHIWHGKGWEEPGHWAIGTYTVKVYLRKQLIAQRNFEIVPDEALPAQPRFNGFYYHKGDNGAYWIVELFEDGRVIDILIQSSTYGFDGILHDVYQCAVYDSCSDLDVGQGKYSIQGSNIEFTTSGAFRRDRNYILRVNGTITNTALKLNWTNNNQSGTNLLTFTRCPYRGC